MVFGFQSLVIWFPSSWPSPVTTDSKVGIGKSCMHKATSEVKGLGQTAEESVGMIVL